MSDSGKWRVAEILEEQRELLDQKQLITMAEKRGLFGNSILKVVRSKSKMAKRDDQQKQIVTATPKRVEAIAQQVKKILLCSIRLSIILLFIIISFADRAPNTTNICLTGSKQHITKMYNYKFK